MFTNDIKKGTRIQMRNGWLGTMMDNGRGNTRVVEVEGTYTETGSVYAHDIMFALVNGAVNTIVHTSAQLKCKEMNAKLFGGVK